MKILFLATSYPRFKDDWVLPSLEVEAKELAKKNEVLVISSAGTDTKNYEIRNNVKIIRFNNNIKKYQTLTYTGGMLTAFQKSLLSKIQIPLFLLMFTLKTFRYGKDCDVIHAHWTPSVIAAIPIKIIYKKPIILSPLGGDTRAIPRWFNNIAFKYSEGIIVPVESAQDYVKESGYEKKILKIGCCYDYDKFDKKDDISDFKKEFNLKNEKIVTFLGRMDPFKDPITFVKSIPYVLKKIKNIKFFIVGYGFLLEDVKALVKKLNLEEYVVITGPRKDTNIILEASDIFVNLSPEENFFSVAIQEALAKRIPVLLTNAGKTEVIFKHKESSYLVNPESPVETAKAIIEILTDKKINKKLKKEGIKLLKKHGFTKEDVIGNLESTYEKMVKK